MLILFVLAAAGGGLLVGGRRTGSPPGGFPTPAAAIDALYDATVAGDAAAYLRCLDEPLLAHERGVAPGVLAELLRWQTQGMRGRGNAGEVVDGDRATVEVDEVFATGTRRVRFTLARGAGGWLVVAVDRGPERPAAIPYGTHIKDVGK
jgi:hypothetical protein